eukprot:gnl/MRDRNA2_/MRDRNA2_30630_c0_seq1.p1 gnl/MRDRNA2_/MRDRNA2_30630_c0~~gnl/MRDRNA2_/MRDRNA2_30630_c0_seq1.p1  ORF type:complete len:377 (+),score=52.20 gnl/MRDRNA2_/MRDRNA2_30630_c0_seq1:121-1251(+)
MELSDRALTTSQSRGKRPGKDADAESYNYSVISSIVARGVTLKTKVWYPNESPAAIVVFLHGYAAGVTNRNDWQRTARVYTAKNILCAGMDYPGHGRNEKVTSWKSYYFPELDDVQKLVDDVLQFVGKLVEKDPGLPVFLQGQSMGSIVAIAVALRKPGLFRGLLLGAPAYELHWHVALGARLFAPRAITEAAAYVKQNISTLETPLAVFQGTEDYTASPHGALHLVQAAGSADKSLYLYENTGHNVSPESDALQWMMRRIGSQVPSRARLYIRKPEDGRGSQSESKGKGHVSKRTMSKEDLIADSVSADERLHEDGSSLDEVHKVLCFTPTPRCRSIVPCCTPDVAGADYDKILKQVKQLHVSEGEVHLTQGNGL